MADSPERRLLSVVVPLFNEEGNLEELHRRVCRAMEGARIPFELILVDDGSTDGSLPVIRRLARDDNRVRYASFSRNFGHEAASTCGLRMARGDAAVLMDSDLQDPPELLPDMAEKWKAGNDVVYAIRRSREKETLFKKATSFLFYRIMNLFSDLKLPLDTGDFRLMDRKVLDVFNHLSERNRFVRGLVFWTGFRQEPIEFDRAPRKEGETKYGVLKLFFLSVDALFGFSLAPLRLCLFLGLLITLTSFLVAGVVMVQRLFFGLAIPGYALLATGIFFFGGIQLFFIGILGEYMGKVYSEVQGRPLYVVRESNAGEEPSPG